MKLRTKERNEAARKKETSVTKRSCVTRWECGRVGRVSSKAREYRHEVDETCGARQTQVRVAPAHGSHPRPRRTRMKRRASATNRTTRSSGEEGNEKDKSNGKT